MGGQIHWEALGVYVFFFLLVTVMSFCASRWQTAGVKKEDQIEQWGPQVRYLDYLVSGRRGLPHGLRGDRGPSLGLRAGRVRFLRAAILVYPTVFVIMPRLWQESKQNGHVTAADAVYGRNGCRKLELAVAVTGVLARLPYIALQLVGMQVVIRALDLRGELPLAAAFAILALYTYSAGLRAPARIAFVKDLMIYIVVLVAVVLVPSKLGGYAHVFQTAADAFAAKGGATGLILQPAPMLPYASLALGSALAAFTYPHTLTGTFAATSANTIRKTASFLPAYTILLGLIALLGYMAHAARLPIEDNNDVVPALFHALFPAWFSGFAFAAIAIGALVPATVMSIGAANLFTRNFWMAYVRPDVSPAGEAKVAKLVSLVIKVGALVIILFLPTRFAIDLQLLCNVWILQTFPAVVFGLFLRWFGSTALLCGWAAGLVGGSWLALADSIKPVHTFMLGGTNFALYTGITALGLNVVVAALVQVGLGGRTAPTRRIQSSTE